ncbi:MAG: hypothetical protein QXG39_09435 [Candidatus Aenigmatarchaeota archaeon]
MNKEEKRIVKNCEELVFFTNTDEKNYPVYITSNREVWLKAKPHRVEEVEDKWGYVSPKRIYDIPISATFFVKEVAETNEDIKHPLLEKAISIFKEVTKNDAEVKRLFIKYEIYQGDMEKIIGEAETYVIKVASVETPFSGSKYAERKAWAVGYDWKRRIVAKAPELESYTYVKGAEGRRGRAYVKVITKLPVPTEEFTRLFNLALSSTVTQVSVTSEIEQQIKQIEELIKQKENELQALREQLQQLQLKLQLEQMKRQVV